MLEEIQGVYVVTCSTGTLCTNGTTYTMQNSQNDVVSYSSGTIMQSQDEINRLNVAFELIHSLQIHIQELKKEIDTIKDADPILEVKSRVTRFKIT